MRRILFFISVLSLFSFNVEAQQFPFRTYSIEHGLSESVVNDIIQDDDGFIWMATGFGLNRFDGIDFEHFYTDQGLKSSKIYALEQSQDSKIWVGTELGVNFLLGDSVYSEPLLNGLNNSMVISIFEDSEGGIWFGTDGDGVWHLIDDDIEFYTTANGLINNQVRSITQTEDGALWFATRNGISRLLNGNFRNFDSSSGLPENRTRDLLLDSTNRLWVATRNGIAYLDEESFIAIPTAGLVDVKVRSLSENNEGELWLGTEGGISKFNGTDFTNYTTIEGLSSDIVYSSLTDREGNLWFGTFGGGASVFLGEYFMNFDTRSGLPNNLVTTFSEHEDGELWLGTYGGGLLGFEKDGNFLRFGEAEGLPDERVYTLFTDSKDRTWVGMRDGLAYIQRGRVLELDERTFPYRKVRNVMEDTQGNFWISTYDEGLIWLSAELDESEQYDINNGLAHNTVLNTVEKPDGSIWIATYGGVQTLKDGEFETYSTQEGLPNNGVMMVMMDQTETIWASTFGGIAWFDGVQFVDITEDDGLPGSVCYFIGQDRAGIYWVGTNNGIARINIQNFYSDDPELAEQGIQVINREQGLISNEANLGAFFEDQEGKLWFGTVDGLSIFDPQKYRGNQIPPKLHFEEITASGRAIGENNLNLKHTRNYLQFNFKALNFSAPSQVLYEHKLSGIDPDWQRTSNRIAKYPSLPAGEYTFRVRARNSSGIWSEEIARYSFTIQPPFWFSWWFITLILSVIVGIIYLFYRNYQYMKMVDIERMRVRIASDLHDDVGASLTEVALQSDFLQASNIDNEFRESLQQIGKQCRKIVTSLDDIVWSIDARNDTLGDLTDRMQDYILNVLEHNNFEVRFEFEDLKMNNKIPVPVKENLYLIFKEAVNNIAKYSNGDKVHISLKALNGEIDFQIHDNGTSGKGLKKTGQGLRNMEMRAKRIGGILHIDDTKGFTIVLKGTLNLN